MMAPAGSRSAPACRTCGGNGKIPVKVGGKEQKLDCPACRGTGKSGLVTK